VILWLASFPRSGNTMVRMLLHHVYGTRTHSLYEEESQPALAAAVGSAGQFDQEHLERLRRRSEWYVVKTHGFPLDDSPALCVVRDGRDALVSYAHFIRAYETAAGEQPSFGELLRHLIVSRDRFGGWSGHLRGWYQRPSQAPTVWVRYEDLLAEPHARLVTALRAVGWNTLPIGRGHIHFGDLHRTWPDFFRQGRVGSWRDEMSEDLHALFWANHQEAMEYFAYSRGLDTRSLPGSPAG
jgi:Sulfotransferase domain